MMSMRVYAAVCGNRNYRIARRRPVYAVILCGNPLLKGGVTALPHRPIVAACPRVRLSTYAVNGLPHRTPLSGISGNGPHRTGYRPAWPPRGRWSAERRRVVSSTACGPLRPSCHYQWITPQMSTETVIITGSDIEVEHHQAEGQPDPKRRRPTEYNPPAPSGVDIKTLIGTPNPYWPEEANTAAETNTDLTPKQHARQWAKKRRTA